MPNIAFLSLVYLLLAVPGFLVRSSYYSGEFTSNLLPRSWTDEIGKAILYSVPFHFLWVLIVGALQRIGLTHHTLEIETVIRLLSGEYGEGNNSLHGIILRFYDNAWHVLFFYLGGLGTALLVGNEARKLVWGKELDVNSRWLRYRSEWLYKIMGRGQLKGVPMNDTEAWVDILSEQGTSVPGKAILYRGLAAGYTTEENGALRDIILADVKRTDGEKDASGTIRWVRVPGRFFVMSYSKVRNMNVTYEQHSKKILRQIESLSLTIPSGSTPPGHDQSSHQRP